jgi:OPA family glycerol-3-phosphate transporter-like MFS transporter
MIQLGQVAINYLAKIILAGFVIGVMVVPKDDWRWLFRIPTIFAAVMAVLVALIPKETPEQAGYVGCITDDSEVGGAHSTDVRVDLKTSFITIFRHPLVWFYALAYACTGAVRQSSDQLAVLYFVKYMHLEVSAFPSLVTWTFALIPLVAVIGSFASGVISDKVFGGRRSPVALGLYVMIGAVCAVSSILMLTGLMAPTASGIMVACAAQLLVSFSVNATHSLVGTAAPMDIGGRKMAGFASGVIDSFQYYGAAIVLPISGWLIDHYGWNTWFPVMVVFGGIGAAAMLFVMRKQRLMTEAAR